MTLAGTGSAARPRRADAERNYRRLLDQAKVVFAEAGVDASLDEIARRAGVASGTLYRHFPTRQAVLAEQISALVASGRGLLAEDDAFAALAAWLRATLVHGLTYRGLSAAVLSSALDRDREVVSRWHAELFEVGAALVERARSSGAVVADADAMDVLKLIGAIAWAAQDAPEGVAQADRLLGLVLNGLRRGVR
jgi:AcrR family transcriptional regulator